MPASYKAVKAKSCLQRNIVTILDVKDNTKYYPEMRKKKKYIFFFEKVQWMKFYQL